MRKYGYRRLGMIMAMGFSLAGFHPTGSILVGSTLTGFRLMGLGLMGSTLVGFRLMASPSPEGTVSGVITPEGISSEVTNGAMTSKGASNKVIDDKPIKGQPTPSELPTSQSATNQSATNQSAMSQPTISQPASQSMSGQLPASQPATPKVSTPKPTPASSAKNKLTSVQSTIAQPTPTLSASSTSSAPSAPSTPIPTSAPSPKTTLTTNKLIMDPNKRLTAPIAKDVLNRIAIVNDRITQVFGDAESYEIQTEEKSGQVFLKPSAENGSKPLSLTIITENGLTQDVLLEPKEKSASTVILHPPPGLRLRMTNAQGTQLSAPSGGLYPSPLHSFGGGLGNGTAGGLLADGLTGGLTGGTASGMPYNGLSNGPSSIPTNIATLPIQEKVIHLMKLLIGGRGIPIEDYGYDRPCPKGLSILKQSTVLLGEGDDNRMSDGFSYHPSQGVSSQGLLGPYRGLILSLKNVTSAPIDIHDRDFYSPGDWALCFDDGGFDAGSDRSSDRGFRSGSTRRVLRPDETATLYVVTSASTPASILGVS